MNKPITIGGACSITTGKLDSNELVTGGRYPFFTCAQEPLEIDHYAFDDSVILIAGNNAVGNFHVTRYTGKFNAYQRTYVLTSKGDNDLDYLYYSLKLLLRLLKEHSQGSQTKFLTIGILKSLEVPNRKLADQQKIAKVLSTLDAKIELNNRINAELEAMAKLLYEYWFVQFDFPMTAEQATALGKPELEGKPYKTSGGKMVFNPTLKRDIPEGWRTDAIPECCEIVDCLHSKKPDYCNESASSYLLQLENIRDDGLLDVAKKHFVSNADYERWTSRIEVTDGDLLVTNAGRVGASAQVPKPVTTGIGRNITAIRPVSICHTYFYLSFRGLDVKRQIANNTDQGAFFKSLNVKGIKLLRMLRPPLEIEGEFEAVVLPMRRRREAAIQQNQELTELRDWLLPMLMNGQVSVSA